MVIPGTSHHALPMWHCLYSFSVVRPEKEKRENISRNFRTLDFAKKDNSDRLTKSGIPSILLHVFWDKSTENIIFKSKVEQFPLVAYHGSRHFLRKLKSGILVTNDTNIKKAVPKSVYLPLSETHIETLDDSIRTETPGGEKWKFVGISYASDFSRQHKLQICDLSKMVVLKEVPVSNELVGQMHITEWKTNFVVDGYKTFEIWDKDLNFISSNSTNPCHSVDFVKCFCVWEGNLVVGGYNGFKVWSTGSQTISKTTKFELILDVNISSRDVHCMQVVWGNMLAVAAQKLIFIYHKNGNLYQVLRGHSGSIWKMIFFMEKLVSVCIDGKVIVWNSSGEILWGMESHRRDYFYDVELVDREDENLDVYAVASNILVHWKCPKYIFE